MATSIKSSKVKLPSEVVTEIIKKAKDGSTIAALSPAKPKKFADDTILIHMKDGKVKQNVGGKAMVNGILDRKVDLMPLGTGDLPIKDLVAAAPEQVETIVVELDYCNIDMNTAIEQSYKYMVENGLAKGNK